MSLPNGEEPHRVRELLRNYHERLFAHEMTIDWDRSRKRCLRSPHLNPPDGSAENIDLNGVGGRRRCRSRSCGRAARKSYRSTFRV